MGITKDVFRGRNWPLSLIIHHPHSFLNGNQVLIFNTNYNNVESNEISFTIDLDYTDLSGDLNDDNETNILDIIIIVNIILDEQFNNLADINEDGIINIIDIILLVNIILD